MQTRYGYDAFGNRTLKEEGTVRTTYRHNALNQLVAEIREGREPVNKSFAYDKRGNLTRITENGQMTQQYVYGALNRLEEAVNQAGKAAKYQYNGLGHRVGKLEGSLPAARMEQMEKHLNPQSRIHMEIGNQRQISYTIDLTREYLPRLGQFTGLDVIPEKIETPFKSNRYRYCYNNPTKWIDLDGKQAEDVQYIAAVYLVNQEGAYGQGHAALLLLKDNGNSEFYSYAGEANIGAFTFGSEGYLSTHVDTCGNPQDINTELFFKNGGVRADSVRRRVRTRGS